MGRGLGAMAGGGGLVPDVLFIPFNLVLAEEFAQFVLEGLFVVVLRLALDVVSDGAEVRCAYREGGVAGLPGESGWEFAGLVHPGRGGELDLFQCGGNGDGSAQLEEDVDMVVHAADQEGLAAAVVCGATDDAKELVAPVRMDHGFAALGGEDRVEIDLAEGLAHVWIEWSFQGRMSRAS